MNRAPRLSIQLFPIFCRHTSRLCTHVHCRPLLLVYQKIFHFELPLLKILSVEFLDLNFGTAHHSSSKRISPANSHSNQVYYRPKDRALTLDNKGVPLKPNIALIPNVSFNLFKCLQCKTFLSKMRHYTMAFTHKYTEIYPGNLKGKNHLS